MREKVIEILQNTNVDLSNYEYVAVDKNGKIYGYANMPIREEHFWDCDSSYCASGKIGYIKCPDKWYNCCWKIEDLMSTKQEAEYTLDYVLNRNGACVYFYIIKQDERLTAKRCNELYFNHNNFEIKSYSVPAIPRKLLYIRGFTKSCDDYVITREFDSEEEAQQYVNDATEALEALKKKGFPREVFSKHPDNGTLYWYYDDVDKCNKNFVWQGTFIDRCLYKSTPLYKTEN